MNNLGDYLNGFSLLTLNTWKCDGDYLARLPLMAQGIRELAPDVVFLQEAFSAPGQNYDTAAYIADNAGYEIARAPARRKVRVCENQRVDSTSDLVILTRDPVIFRNVISLPSHPDDSERIALIVDVDTALGPVGFVNVHLTHLPESNGLRRQQFEAAVAHLSTGPYVIVAGDFNCTKEALPALGEFVKGFRIYQSTADGPHQLRGGTLNPVSDYASGPQASFKGQAIDHVFILRSGEGGDGMSLTGVKTVLNAADPSTGIYASDHAGVLVKISKFSQ